MKRGFTLIELLVVVLIIGILAAIALPQYQKAVLKSRFSSLMPTTKAIRDGNEMYYMTNNQYASEVSDLDVKTESTEDMTINLHRGTDYTYTFATREDLNGKNNLIMYQKHSVQFPGEVHCEAKNEDSQAEWLCRTALHAVKEIGEVITPGYNTFVIEGTGDGLTPAQLANATQCASAVALGATCSTSTDEETNTTTTTACYNVNGTGDYCVFTEKDAENKPTKRTVCTSDGCTEYVYDENGDKIWMGTCGAEQMKPNKQSCAEYDSQTKYEYEEEDDSILQHRCSVGDIDENCESYSGTITFGHDEEGNSTDRECTVGRGGKVRCTEHITSSGENGSSSWVETCTTSGFGGMSTRCTSSIITSGDNGTQIEKVCADTCDEYNAIYQYVLDDQGNRLSKQTCSSWDNNTGICSEWNEIEYEYNG